MKKTLAAAALLLAAGSATAQLYVGASAGGSRWNLDTEARCPGPALQCDRNDFGARAYAGLRFGPDWGLELGAHDFGKARVSSAATGAETATLGLRGAHLLVSNRLDAGDAWRLNTRFGVAMNRVEVEGAGPGLRDDKEKAAFYFGIGAAWQLSRSVALRLDLDTTRGEYGSEKMRAIMYGAGVEFEF